MTALLAALFVQALCFPIVLMSSGHLTGYRPGWLMAFRKWECDYTQLTGLERDTCLHCGFMGNMALRFEIVSQFLHPQNSRRRQRHVHLQHHTPAGREHAVSTWHLCFNWTDKSNKSTRWHLKSYSPIHFTVTQGIAQGQWDMALTLKVIDF